MKITEKRLKQIIKEEMEYHDSFVEFQDEEGGMAKRQLENLAAYASELASMLDENTQLEGWVQSKITLAQDYISEVKHHLEGELGMTSGGCGEPLGVHPADGFEIEDEDLYSLFEQ
jgi:hypothetical protein